MSDLAENDEATRRVSVVIVSHGRPKSLALCLAGVAQLEFPEFEIVVVADAAGIAGVRHNPQIKLVPFDTANIAAARNAGIAVAAGEIVAFIDDDAVPEPTWLTHLIAPFSDPMVSAAGGYVLGRNGISFQWKGRSVGPDAQTADLTLSSDQPQIFKGSGARAIKTEGTNMAVRRCVLLDLGGFDPAFQFYLDETDLNMRLGQSGHKTAIVPLALVHHGYRESARRTVDRVPRDLHQIGASLAVYLRKHGGGVDRFDAERAGQRHRLLVHLVAGRLVPTDVKRILSTFDAGWAEGLKREFGATTTIAAPPAFRSFAGQMKSERITLSGRFWQRRALLSQADKATKQGYRVTVILLSMTSKFHVVRFVYDGYWLQTGGQFGKSDRDDPIIQFWRARTRIRREKARVSLVR